jgi:L-alanine-DL-glutamate epimerase-like enolase superfamily enzyme
VNKGFHGVTADSGRFVVAGDSLLVHDGRMAVPDGPGIGIEIDRALLEVRKREEVLISTPVTAGADR